VPDYKNFQASNNKSQMVRQAHHPEQGRRAISKCQSPMTQTRFEFDSLYFGIYLEFEFYYLRFN
jgi:hypothetical protein